MENILTLAQIVASTLKKYVTPSFNAKLYYSEDPATGIYSVIVVPSQPKSSPHVMLLVQVTENSVAILSDTTDRPLEDALVRAGIPREKIAVAYRGEPALVSR